MLPSNISAVYTPTWQETLIGGVLQGRKQFDRRGASRVCRMGLWKAVAEIAKTLTIPMFIETLRSERYGQIKRHVLLKNRENVKEDVQMNALQGWLKNNGDEEFILVDY